MDQQDKHVPTPEEIARAEAEAVKAQENPERGPSGAQTSRSPKSRTISMRLLMPRA